MASKHSSQGRYGNDSENSNHQNSDTAISKTKAIAKNVTQSQRSPIVPGRKPPQERLSDKRRSEAIAKESSKRSRVGSSSPSNTIDINRPINCGTNRNEQREQVVINDLLVMIKKQNEHIAKIAERLERLENIVRSSQSAQIDNTSQNGRNEEPEGKNKSPAVSRKYKGRYEEIMGDRLKLLDTVFSVEYLRRRLLNVICLHIVRGAKAEFMPVKYFLELLRILKYTVSFSEGDKKSKNNNDIGSEACTFRRSVVMKCVRRAQVNADDIYATDDSNSGRSPYPFWLRGNMERREFYIPEKAILSGFDRRENVSNNKYAGDKRRMEIVSGQAIAKPADYGEYVGYYGYSQLIKHLCTVRRLNVTTFYEIFWYLFNDLDGIVEEEAKYRKTI